MLWAAIELLCSGVVFMPVWFDVFGDVCVCEKWCMCCGIFVRRVEPSFVFCCIILLTIGQWFCSWILDNRFVILYYNSINYTDICSICCWLTSHHSNWLSVVYGTDDSCYITCTFGFCGCQVSAYLADSDCANGLMSALWCVLWCWYWVCLRCLNACFQGEPKGFVFCCCNINVVFVCCVFSLLFMC